VNVQASDGKVIAFPASMSKADVQAALARLYPGRIAPPRPPIIDTTSVELLAGPDWLALAQAALTETPEERIWRQNARPPVERAVGRAPGARWAPPGRDLRPPVSGR
jgi:hypothetical protein